jgi:hypothetical protein
MMATPAPQIATTEQPAFIDRGIAMMEMTALSIPAKPELALMSPSLLMAEITAHPSP